MSNKTNGRGDTGDGNLGRGEDRDHHICYPHGAWGRGSSRTSVAGQGKGLGSELGSNQVGKRKEPGSLLPHIADVTSGLVPSCQRFACSGHGGSFRAKMF